MPGSSGSSSRRGTCSLGFAGPSGCAAFGQSSLTYSADIIKELVEVVLQSRPTIYISQ